MSFCIYLWLQQRLLQQYLKFVFKPTISTDYEGSNYSSQGHTLLSSNSKKHPFGCFFYSKY